MPSKNSSKVRFLFSVVLAMGVGIFAAYVIVQVPSTVRASFSRTSVVYAAGSDDETIKPTLTRRALDHIASLFTQVEKPNPPATSARSYIIGDVKTGEIVAALNADAVYPIASVSKLFTTVTAKRVFDPEASFTVSKSALATYGSSGGLVRGEVFTFDEILKPLLLESDNDAAEVIAEGYGREEFMREMNTTAQALELSNTSFDDPSGLSALNVSSAQDLFAFAQYLYKEHPDVIKKTRVNTTEVSRTPLHSYHYWHNRNSFVSNDDELYIGGKTGYTPEAAQTMIAFFTISDGALVEHTYAVVVLQSGARNQDVAKLMNFATDGLYSALSSAATTLLGSAAYNLDEPVETTSLLFVGDIMLDRGVEQSVRENFDGDFGELFAQAGFLGKADITFGNLEGPLSDRGYDLQNLYSFRMNPEALDALKEAGFDVLSLANNHIGDWGRPALEDTMRRLHDAGLAYVGTGFNRADAIEPRVITRDGVSYGYLAFSDQGPAWLAGPNDSSLVLLANDGDRVKLIEEAASKVDVLIVSYHFGEEYETEPNARQRDIAESSIDAGATIVVGHHPHVIQPVERYGDGLIAYSLGNFIFDQPFSEETMEGLALEVVFEDTKIVRVTPREVVLTGRYEPKLVE